MAGNQVKASLMNYRISAQKARLVADQVRNKGVEEALNILAVSQKGFAKPLSKLLHSALANAEDQNDTHNAGFDVDRLKVSTITVDEGPGMWRIRPRAQGRASWIQKRTSHIKVVLSE
jgi:large subunit ribosomal protein L22